MYGWWYVMAVVVEFSIIPLGAGVSVSKVLAPAIKTLKDLGVEYRVTPMCTIFEATNISEAFKIIREAHEAVFRDNVERVVTIIKVDDRRDVERGMEEKVKSLMEAVKEV